MATYKERFAQRASEIRKKENEADTENAVKSNSSLHEKIESAANRIRENNTVAEETAKKIIEQTNDKFLERLGVDSNAMSVKSEIAKKAEPIAKPFSVLSNFGIETEATAVKNTVPHTSKGIALSPMSVAREEEDFKQITTEFEQKGKAGTLTDEAVEKYTEMYTDLAADKAALKDQNFNFAVDKAAKSANPDYSVLSLDEFDKEYKEIYSEYMAGTVGSDEISTFAEKYGDYVDSGRYAYAKNEAIIAGYDSHKYDKQIESALFEDNNELANKLAAEAEKEKKEYEKAKKANNELLAYISNYEYQKHTNSGGNGVEYWSARKNAAQSAYDEISKKYADINQRVGAVPATDEEWYYELVDEQSKVTDEYKAAKSELASAKYGLSMEQSKAANEAFISAFKKAMEDGNRYALQIGQKFHYKNEGMLLNQPVVMTVDDDEITMTVNGVKSKITDKDGSIKKLAKYGTYEQKQAFAWLYKDADAGGIERAKYYASVIEPLHNSSMMAETAKKYAEAEGAERLWMATEATVQSGVDNIIQGITGIGKAITGDDSYTPPSDAALNFSAILEAEDNNVSKLLMQGGSAAIAMTPMIVVSLATGGIAGALGGAGTVAGATAVKIGAGVSKVVFTAQAFGNGYIEAINSGAGYYDALGYGTLGAGLELLTESIGGGIEVFGGSVAGRVASKGIAKAVAKLKVNPRVAAGIASIGKLAVNGVLEGFEESLSAVVSPVLKNLYLSQDNDLFSDDHIAEIIESGILGIISSSFVNAPYARTYYREALQNGTFNRLMNGLASDADIEAILHTEKMREYFANITGVQLSGREDIARKQLLAFNNGAKKRVVDNSDTKQYKEPTKERVERETAFVQKLVDEANAISDDSSLLAQRSAQESTGERTTSVSDLGNTIPTPEQNTVKTPLKSLKGAELEQQLDALTAANEPITVDEVKKATSFGDAGSVLVTELANADGVTFTQAKNAVETAYRAGYTNVNENEVSFVTDTQKLAFKAGKEDRRIYDNVAVSKANNATVYETGFTENEYSAKLTPAEREVFTFLAKDLKMDVEVVDKIIAAKVNGIEYEANAQHSDGQTRVSSTANSMFRAGVHESWHRVKQLNPEGFGILADFIYNHTDKNGILFEQVKEEHDRANISMDADKIIEEIAVRQLENFVDNPEAFLEWRKSLDANPQAKSAWKKFCEVLKEFLEDLWAAVTNSKMSLQAKRQAQAEINEARRLLDAAYKGAMDAAETRAKNSQNDSEINTNKAYNGSVSNSLKKPTHKKSTYNEYNTFGMQWAYDSSTKIGDRKVLHNPYTNKYVLVEATKDDVGFIELYSGTYEQMREDAEKYESNEQGNFTDDERAIDTAIYNFETGQDDNTRNNVDVGNRGKGIQNAEVSEGESGSNRTADSQAVDGNISYSLKVVDEGYSTEGTKWAIANGLLSKQEQALFWKRIADLTKNKYHEPKSKSGQYIIDLGRKLVFTNGDFKATTINCVIEFVDRYETNIIKYKELIIDEERTTAQHGESIQIIEIVHGEGYVSEHYSSDYRTDARKNGRGKGKDSREYSSVNGRTNGGSGSLLSDDSSKRPHSTSTGKQAKRVDGRSSRYRERRGAGFERRKYCQTLKTTGKTERRVILGHICEVIPEAHYLDDMKKIVNNNLRDGYDTIFVTGGVQIPFTNDGKGNNKIAKGVFINYTSTGKKTIIVQYDNEFFMPTQINDHEKIHDRYNTPLVQKVKNIIKSSLSSAEQNNVLNKLSKDYNGIIKGNEEKIFEEFVANVLSNMDYTYLGKFTELQKAFWNNDTDFIDSFKIAEYTTDTDAGGPNYSDDAREIFVEDAYINYSLKGDSKDTKKLLDTIDKLKHEFELTKFAKADPKKLAKITKELLKDYESEASYDSTFKAIDELYTYMANGEDGHPAVWEEVYAKAKNISSNIVEYATIRDDSMYQQYKDLRDYLRKTPMKINTKHDDVPMGYENFLDFRRKNFGRLNFTKDGKGVDVVYQELAELYPEFFDAQKQITSQDMLERITSVLDDIQPTSYNPYESQTKEATAFLANDIINRFFDVPQAKPTFADKAERKVVNTRIAAQKKLDKLREQRDAKIEKEKAKRKEALSKMSEKQKAKVLRANIIKHAGELDKTLRKATDQKHIPPELENAVVALLYNINMESSYSYDVESHSYKKTDKGLPTNKTQAFLRLKEVYEQIATNNDYGLTLASELVDTTQEGVANIFDEVMKLSDKKIADMTSEELTKIYDAMRIIESSIVTANKMFAMKKWEGLTETAKAFEKSVATLRPKRSLTKSHYTLDYETPITFFSHFGEAGEELYRALRESQDNEQLMVDELAEYVQSFVSLEQVDKAEKELFEFTTSEDKKLTLSKAHIMDIYLLNNRKQGKKHLLYDPESEHFGDGIRQPEIKSKGIRRGKENIRLIKADLGHIISKLDESDKAIANKMQKATLLLAKWGNKACMEVFGYEKFNDPDYWTIKSASEGTNQTPERNKDIARSIKNMGSAKAVEDKATNALDIGGVFNVFNQHASDMICYSAWLGVMEDATKLYNYTLRDNEGYKTNVTFRDLLEKYAGEGGGKYYFNLMKDIQNGIGISPDTATENIYTKLYGAAAKAKVAYKATVVAQQPMAIVRAANVLNPLSIIQATVKGGVNVPIWAASKLGKIAKIDSAKVEEWYGGWQRALKYAPISSRKAIGGYEINSHSAGLKNVLYKPSTKTGKTVDFLKESPLWMAGKADEITWGVLWNACEIEVNKDKSFEKGSEEYYKETAKLFSKVINETQVVDGVLQRSQIMRSSSGMIKHLTAFKGEPIMGLNTVIRAYDKVRYETDPAKRGKAIRTFSRAVVVYLANAVFTAFARSLAVGGTGEDDDKYWEKVWKSFSGVQGDEETWFDYVKNIALKSDVVNNLNPLTWLPLASELMSFAQGYDVERLDVASVGEFFDAGKKFVDSIDDDGKYKFGYATRNLLLKGAELTGYSPNNLIRDIEGIIRTTRVETNDVKGLYDMEKWRTKPASNTSKYIDILYRAYTTDKEAYEYIYNDMVENGVDADTIKNGMETRMKKAEDIEKTSDLSKRYMTPETEKKYDTKLKQIQSSKLWKSANTEQRKNAEADLYNFLTSTSEGMEKLRAEARAFGVDETEYTLWQLAKEMHDYDANDSLNAKEKAAAIEKLNFGDSELAYFYGTEQADEAYAYGIDMRNYAMFKAAVSGLKGNDKNEKVIAYADEYASNDKEWWYFVATVYSSYKNKNDYIKYFGN